jgi:hypothetical protein
MDMKEKAVGLEIIDIEIGRFIKRQENDPALKRS